MKKLLLFSFLTLSISHFSTAQLSRYMFDGDMNMKMSLRYGTLNNTKIESDKIGGVAFRFYDLGLSNYSDSRYQYSGRWAFIPETFSTAVFDILLTQNFEWASYTPNIALISDFLLGWHNFAWAVSRQDYLQVSLGVHGHDYFYAFQPENKRDLAEPAGWYIGTGPALMIDYDLLGMMVLHFEGTYTLTKKINDVPEMIVDRSYPSPHFMNFLLEVRPNSRLYAGIEHIRSYNRGSTPNDGTRTDIHIGLKLFVDE